MKTNYKLILSLSAGIAIGVALYWWKTRKMHYVYLGSPYRPEQAGSRGEVSEECLQHPGYRMCSLTDGTSGVCGTSGRCVTDMSVDIRSQWDEVNMPVCYEPLLKEGCTRFCRCQQLKGGVLDHEVGDCVAACRENFHPS